MKKYVSIYKSPIGDIILKSDVEFLNELQFAKGTYGKTTTNDATRKERGIERMSAQAVGRQ